MSSAAPISNAPAAPPASAPNGSAPAAAPAPPWYGEIADPDLKGFVELKKPGDAATALKGWRDAEKFIGAPKEELLRLPKDLNAAKPEEMAAIFDRLGRPKTPDDYKIDQVEGGEEFTKTFRPILHGLGLNQAQVTQLTTAWNAYMKTTVEAGDRAQEQQEQLDLQNLHREWPGETFTQREEMARRAVREFVNPLVGGDQAKAGELLGNIEDAIGTANFLKLFSGIGEKVGEGTFIGSNKPSTFGMTPAAAKSQLDQNMQDKDWATAVYNKKQPQYGEWERLVALAAQAPKG